MKKKTILAVFALAFLTLLPYLATKSTVNLSNSEATARIEPNPVISQLWEDFDVSITVYEVINLRGFEIWFQYDPDLLEYRGNDTSQCMLNATRAEFPPADKDEVKVYLYPAKEIEPRNGSGTLVTFKFRGNKVGDGPFYCNCTPYIPSGRGPIMVATGSCTVTNITRTIKVRSDWTLPGDIDFSRIDPVFAVLADDVVLDLNGHNINNTKGGGYGIDVQNRTHVTIENGTITNFQFGIKVTEKCDRISITNVKILNSKDYAIKIENSTNVRIYNNNVSNSIGGGSGIEVESNTYVTIENGNITNFKYGIHTIECDQVNITRIKILNSTDYAMNIEKSTNVRIYNNTVSNSTLECVSLSSCSLSEVSHNILSNNKFYGIDMRDSTNNNITHNTISNNTPAGIHIEDSSQNKIFNNNFINNTDEQHEPKHAIVEVIHKASNNVWSSSYPYGGNYWDDWNDTARLSIQSTKIVDEKSGTKRTVPGPDGIGDTAYVIDQQSNNLDEYPLLNPCGSVLQVHDIRRVKTLQGKNVTTALPAAVFTNSSVADFKFNSNGTSGFISFNVSGQCTFCKVIVSRELLDSISEIKVDNTSVAPFLNLDGDYIFANFTLTAGRHKVEIQGETARRCDIDGDGKVTIVDVSKVAKEFGSTYSYEDP